MSKNCWFARDNKSLSTAKFPDIMWKLQAKVEVRWPPSSYLLRQGSKGHERLCYTFRWTKPLPDGSQVVLGASWMVDQELLFDLTRSRLGLGNSSCAALAPAPKLRGSSQKSEALTEAASSELPHSFLASAKGSESPEQQQLPEVSSASSAGTTFEMVEASSNPQQLPAFHVAATLETVIRAHDAFDNSHLQALLAVSLAGLAGLGLMFLRHLPCCPKRRCRRFLRRCLPCA